MNQRDKQLLDAYERGFALQEEYLGTDKPVNRIDPLVSVRTATYQHAPYIRQCLDSILMQECDFPWEFIIGEDGSTDGTREICIEYAERHPDRIRLFLRDRSLSRYREGKHEIGFNGKWTCRSARGKYHALCEGDDYWTDPKKLQKQVEVMETNGDVVLVHCNADHLDQRTQKRKPNFFPARPLSDTEPPTYFDNCTPAMPRELLFKMKLSARQLRTYELLSGNYHIRTLTACIRSSVLNQLEEEQSCRGRRWRFPIGDLPLWLELSDLGDFHFMDESMGTYRVLENSASHFTAPLPRIRFQCGVLELLSYYCCKHNVPHWFRKRVFADYVDTLLWHAYCNRDAELAERVKSLAAPLAFAQRLLYTGSDASSHLGRAIRTIWSTSEWARNRYRGFGRSVKRKGSAFRQMFK